MAIKSQAKLSITVEDYDSNNNGEEGGAFVRKGKNWVQLDYDSKMSKKPEGNTRRQLPEH